MTIVHTVQANRIMVAIHGDLDMKTADPLRDALDALLERYPGKGLQLDLASVEFIDSSGLGVILGRYRKLKEQGLCVLLTGVRPTVRHVLEVAGIPSIMAVSEASSHVFSRDLREM
ncbi:MAG: anti-sigma factor antagonist [Firmicutes bacterium]|nr:anti-sigma factor antagonist [Bacillota bacterium]